MNTTQVNQLEIELSNLKMEDFDTIVEYVARFKKMKDDIIQVEGNDKIDLKLVSVVLNDFLYIQSFAFIFDSILLFFKDLVTPTLEDVFYNLI